MAICAGTKRDGGRCTATVEPPKTYCWWHDPTNAQARRRAAAKGGKGKAGRELTSIKQRLSELADDVLEGKTEKGVAAVVSQVLNVYLRAISVELKVKEVTELEGRLEELEQTIAQGKEKERWSA
jgi:hypothetical protein